MRGGGAIPDKGRRMKLSVMSAEDLNRDVLKVLYFKHTNNLSWFIIKTTCNIFRLVG